MEHNLMEEWFNVPITVVWWADRTIVRCFDKNDREIDVIAGQTGLSWLVKEDEQGRLLTVDPACIPKSRWEFTGVYVPKERTQEGEQTPVVVTAKGVSDGSLYVAPEVSDRPWDYTNSNGQFVTYTEFKARIADCRACEFFEHKKGVCSVNGDFIYAKTIRAATSCPKDVWGVSPDYDSKLAAKRLKAGNYEAPDTYSPDDQDDFEAEWEAQRAAAGK
jgi:hypothetical protein